MMNGIRATPEAMSSRHGTGTKQLTAAGVPFQLGLPAIFVHKKTLIFQEPLIQEWGAFGSPLFLK